MCKRTCLVIIAAILILIFAIPLGITSMVFVENPKEGECNINNIFGHDLKPFLFGINITGIVVVVAIGFLLIALVCLKKIPLIGILIAIVLNIIIALLWIIIAFEFFLNRGSPCIAQGITYFGYFFVLVVLSIITICAAR